MTALRAAIRWTPIASVIVMTAGNPSGITLTATATTAIKASSQAKPRTRTAKAKSKIPPASTAQVKRRAKLLICLRSGVVSGSTPRSNPLMANLGRRTGRYDNRRRLPRRHHRPGKRNA